MVLNRAAAELPSADMSEKRRKDYKPLALGGLEAYPDRIDGHVGIPQDALPPILQMLIAERDFKGRRDHRNGRGAEELIRWAATIARPA
jgi:hypothetical protein